MTDWTIIQRSLTSRLFSTVTTILTVAVAVGLMLVLLSMQAAGRRAFERGSGNIHLLVSGDTSQLEAVLNAVFYLNPPARPITWAQYQTIADDPRIDFAVPTQQGDSYRGHPVVATTPEFFSRFRPAEGVEWTFAEGGAFREPFEVVLGARVAAATNLQVGETIYLTHGGAESRQRTRAQGGGAMEPHVHTDFSYRVVGILEPTGSAHDRALFTDLTSSWIIHAHDRRRAQNSRVATTTADDLIDADRLITGVYIRGMTRPGSNVSPAIPQVASELRRQTGFTVAAPLDEINNLFQGILVDIDRIFLGLAGVVLVSSGIAIMLALYNSMENRRRQIAVLRVLGASRGRIFGLVLTESAVLGALGAAAGYVLFLIGAQIVVQVLRDRLGLVVDPVVAGRWVLVVILATIVLAALAGIVPAAMAYRTPVSKNLKPLG